MLEISSKSVDIIHYIVFRKCTAECSLEQTLVSYSVLRSAIAHRLKDIARLTFVEYSLYLGHVV